MSIEPTTSFSVSLLQTWPVRVGSDDGLSYEAVDVRPSSETAEALLAEARLSLIAGHLRIEVDNEAGRFVQTLTDPRTMEVLRRFPHESQLAYARAIGAYMNAKAKSL